MHIFRRKARPPPCSGSKVRGSLPSRNSPRLQATVDELEALQDLHLWRTTKIAPDMIQLIYASRYEVSIPCIKYRPTLADVSVNRTKNLHLKERDPFPRFTTLSLQAAQRMLAENDGRLSVRQVRIGRPRVRRPSPKCSLDRRAAG